MYIEIEKHTNIYIYIIYAYIERELYEGKERYTRIYKDIQDMQRYTER